MKKKLLVAAIMATMSLSTAAAFASAPTFSGDANIEYRNSEDSNGLDYLTNRIRLSLDAQIDDTFYIHGRTTMVNDLRGNHNDLISDNGFDQAYLGAKLGNADLRIGRQSMAMGKGLLMDDDKFSGAYLNTKLEGVKVAGFYGQDPSKADTSFVDLGTSAGAVNLGAGFLREADTSFFAVNADTKIANNVTLSAEYAKNTTDKLDGYLAEIKVGDTVKKGDFAYAVSYRNVENGALPGYPTNTNFNDSKGVMLKGIYKVSDKATLTAYQDMVEKKSDGASKDRTNVELSVNF